MTNSSKRHIAQKDLPISKGSRRVDPNNTDEDAEIQNMKVEIARLKEIMDQQSKKLGIKTEEACHLDPMNEKEEKFLRLVSSLIVQMVLKRQEEKDEMDIFNTDGR